MRDSTTSPRLHASAIGSERTLRLDRFGASVELRVQPAPGQTAEAQRRLDRAATLLADVDATLSRFDPVSELSRLNDDPRVRVPASPLMARFAEAVGWAGRRSHGLVDATVLPHVERAGYREHLAVPEHPPTGDLSELPRVPLPQLEAALVDAASDEAGRRTPTLLDGYRHVFAAPGHVVRPAGVRLDSGGLGKGLAADLVADLLRGAPAWLVDCGGDLRLGGTAGAARAVDVRDPLDPSQIVHRLHVTRGAVATSGVTRRSWDQDGVRQHHLIDPRTGEPAQTGVLQVTALAPTGLEAEVLAKTALLSGAERAHEQLTHGGVIVAANGTVTVVAPPRVHQRRRARPRPRAAFQVLPGHGLGQTTARPRRQR